MKHYLKQLLFVVIMSFVFVTAAQAAEETYTFDQHHSYVQWRISHFDFSHPSGKWFVEGTLVLDKEKPQNSKVTANIKVADLDTGIKEFDEHLKAALFFDVKKFPQATFVSDKVIVTGKKTAKVQGMLTLHGVTKPVTLNVTFNKADVSPITNKNTVGFSATTKFKRSEFGMTALLPGVGDEVSIVIEVEANQDKK